MTRFLAIFLLAFTALAAVGLHEDPEHVKPDRGERPEAGVREGPPLPVGDSPDPLAAVADAQAAWFADQERQEQERVAVYLAAVAAERQAQEEARARAAVPQVARSTGSTPTGNTVGECTGFVIPDYIIQRESGGNPNAYNPSGAYGCAQTLLSHYTSGSCRGLDPHTIEGQRECVNILSNGGTNLAPWAQTR